MLGLGVLTYQVCSERLWFVQDAAAHVLEPGLSGNYGGAAGRKLIWIKWKRRFVLCFTSTDRARRWMSLSQKSFLEQFGRLVPSEIHERREKKKEVIFERNFMNKP